MAASLAWANKCTVPSRAKITLAAIRTGVKQQTYWVFELGRRPSDLSKHGEIFTFKSSRSVSNEDGWALNFLKDCRAA